MPYFGGSQFPLFHKMGRRGFLFAAPGFMIAGVVAGIHLERSRTNVTIAPVNKTGQKAKTFGMDQEFPPRGEKTTIKAIRAYRRAQNDVDDLIEQRRKHPSTLTKESKAPNDQDAVAMLSLASTNMRARSAAALMVQAARLRSVELELLGENHPDFARKAEEMSDLIREGLCLLLQVDTADATIEGRIADHEYAANPDENYEKWADNLDGLRWHYSFGFKSVPEDLFKGCLDRRDDVGLTWVTFKEHKMVWEKTRREDST